MERYLSFKKKFLVLFKGWFQWNDNGHLRELFYKRTSSFEKGVVKLSQDLLFGRKFAIWKNIQILCFPRKERCYVALSGEEGCYLKKNIC